MRFLLEVARPAADIETAARAYVKRMIWRGELRWHPELLTEQRVEGFEHLVAARDLGRGVLVNYMHHGRYEGLSPSLARLGVPSHTPGFDHLFNDNTPGWLKQNVRITTTWGSTPVSIAIGSEGIARLLRQGLVVTLASDVPGRTPVKFAGRELLGSFGAARIAASTGSPVIVATSELDAKGKPFIRVHEALHAEDFDSPRALLEEMLVRHERVLLTWPEATDIPLSRWGLQNASTCAEAGT
jgi:lauroyl/myristoyl acyltransferase